MPYYTVYIGKLSSNLHMQRGINLQYKSSSKEFFLSKNTPNHFISALIKKAFHITNDIKCLRHPRGYNIPVQDVFNFNISGSFEVAVEEDNSDDRSRSETFSQKALTKRSGRKYPPQQKQLNDAKLFIDDFHFFMTEVSSKKSEIFIGILFFNNKKPLQYLGKKILRELIYEFDQMQFFYSLHPLKRHSNTPLLGETLIFSLFNGTKMVYEREFPEALSATEQIKGYLKCLIKNGELPECYDENELINNRTAPRQNLIQLNQQRSFDAKISNDLEFDLDPIPHKLEKSKTFTQDEMYTPPISKIQTPIKSHLNNHEVNEISFENDFYQPSWFNEGKQLNRLQRSFLAALVKTGDSQFVSFCHGLDLKNKSKQCLNIQLIKVFLKNYINNKMIDFSQQQRFLIELNQENRQSMIFSLLLKLNKFGNIDDFLQNVRKKMTTLLINKCSYVDLARQIEKQRKKNVIRLHDCDDEFQEGDAIKKLKLISKDVKLEPKYSKIANLFHKSNNIMKIPQKIPNLPKKLSESERAIVIERILQQDPFLIENYIESKWSKKKFTVFGPQIVRKYLIGNQALFGILKTFPFQQNLQKKLSKLHCFNSLLYYLYKQRTISLKQKKAFFYLYIWSDLNVLSTFQLYCYDRNLEDFIETMFIIDYTYYLQDKYGVDMNQVQSFDRQIIIQLVILFLLSQFFDNAQQKTTLQKFIRAGDHTLLDTLQLSKNQTELVETLIEVSEDKKKQFQEIQKIGESQERVFQEKVEQMIQFCRSIIPAHFKHFSNKQQMLKDCIEYKQPMIHGMFDVYFQTKQLVEWMDSFHLYTQNFDKIHMKCILNKICESNSISLEKLERCRTDLVQGAYQVYLQTRDEPETAETLERIVIKSTSSAKTSMIGEKL